MRNSYAKIERYHVKLITSIEEVKGLRTVWESVQSHPGADYEFFMSILRTRANIISPCILVLYRDKNPVALLVGRIEMGKMPIRFGYATLANFKSRQLVFIEGGFIGEKTNSNWLRFLAFVDRLQRDENLDLVVFEQLKVSSSFFDSFYRKFRNSRVSLNSDASKHWLLSLPQCWDDFIGKHSRKHRYWLRRLPKVLDRDFNGYWGIKIYSSPYGVKEFIDAAEMVAAKTYHRSLGVGFRCDNEFLSRIQIDATRGRLRGYVLFIKNKPKAFWYCFVYGKVLYLVATGYDPVYRPYELGTILLLKVFEDHCGTKCDWVDFGLGDADYKRRFASESFFEKSVKLFAKSFRGYNLYILNNINIYVNQFAKKLISQMKISQYVKTRWRQKLVASHSKDA